MYTTEKRGQNFPPRTVSGTFTTVMSYAPSPALPCAYHRTHYKYLQSTSIQDILSPRPSGAVAVFCCLRGVVLSPAPHSTPAGRHPTVPRRVVHPRHGSPSCSDREGRLRFHGSRGRPGQGNDRLSVPTRFPPFNARLAALSAWQLFFGNGQNGVYPGVSWTKSGVDVFTFRQGPVTCTQAA